MKTTRLPSRNPDAVARAAKIVAVPCVERADVRSILYVLRVFCGMTETPADGGHQLKKRARALAEKYDHLK